MRTPVFGLARASWETGEIAHDAQVAWALWWWRAEHALLERDYGFNPNQPLGFGQLHAVHRSLWWSVI